MLILYMCRDIPALAPDSFRLGIQGENSTCFISPYSYVDEYNLKLHFYPHSAQPNQLN